MSDLSELNMCGKFDIGRQGWPELESGPESGHVFEAFKTLTRTLVLSVK